MPVPIANVPAAPSLSVDRRDDQEEDREADHVKSDDDGHHAARAAPLRGVKDAFDSSPP